MPRFLAWGLASITVLFALAGVGYGGRLFFANPAEQRAEQWRRWRNHRLGICRDLVRFYESLAVLAIYSAPAAPHAE